MKKIVLINDLVCYEKIALTSMSELIEKKGYEVFRLPTMLVSNRFNYGIASTQDTTEFMKKAVETWEKLGFCFDAVVVGYIANLPQAEFLVDFCGRQKEKGALIFCDPILGDGGKLYNSVTEKNIEAAKKLLQLADYATPNMTEALFLVDQGESEDLSIEITEEKMDVVLARLRELGVKTPIITSTKTADGMAIIGYDEREKQKFIITYEPLNLVANGAGDRFMAALVSEVMADKPIKESVQGASDEVRGFLLGCTG